MTFSAKPCVVTQREMWTPIAAILSLPTQTDVTRSRSVERAAAIPKSAEGADQDLLEIGHVALDVAPVGREVQDRVAHELSGAVVGDLAAAVGLAHGDAEVRGTAPA